MQWSDRLRANAAATSRSTAARWPGAALTVSNTVSQNSDGLRCAIGTVHRRLHAVARRRVHGIADYADDLAGAFVAESRDQIPGDSNPSLHEPSERLLTRQISTHERLVDNSNLTASHAVAGVEVSAAAQRHAHRLEPARCRGVQPKPGVARAAGHRQIADADHAA